MEVVRRSHHPFSEKSQSLGNAPRGGLMKGSNTWWVASLASLLLIAGCESGDPAASVAADSNVASNTEVKVGKEDNVNVGVDGTIEGNTDGTTPPTDTVEQPADDVGGTDGTDGSTEPEKPTWGTDEYWATYFFPNAWVDTTAKPDEYNVFNIAAFKVGNTNEIVVYNLPQGGEKATDNPCLGTDGAYGLFAEAVDIAQTGEAFACILPDGKIVLSDHLEEYFYWDSFQGTFEEKLVETGYCAGGKADGARQCTRYTDCDDLLGASCKGLAIEVWMHVSYNYNAKLVHRDYLMDPSLFKKSE